MNDLDRLAADLTTAGAEVMARVTSELDQTGRRIRDDARDAAPKTGLQHYAETITHELEHGAGTVAVEVGPEKRGQGSLGHLLEDGVPSRNIAPRAHVTPALDRAAPDFVERLADLGANVL